jgi:hypothetical protein
VPTISAYTSDELKRKIDRIVREEGRNQAQVASTALELYAALPPAARRAFLEFQAAEQETHGGILERALADVARVLLSRKWELLDARVAEEGRRRGELPQRELSEDEIADLAVKLTSKRGRRKRRAG